MVLTASTTESQVGKENTEQLYLISKIVKQVLHRHGEISA